MMRRANPQNEHSNCAPLVLPLSLDLFRSDTRRGAGLAECLPQGGTSCNRCVARAVPPGIEFRQDADAGGPRDAGAQPQARSLSSPYPGACPSSPVPRANDGEEEEKFAARADAAEPRLTTRTAATAK
ncbi:unnamed protein product [Lampetra planeri]